EFFGTRTAATDISALSLHDALPIFICWDLMDGGLKTIGAKTVILATGGAGRLYVGTTNAYACTGDGMAMALRVGVALEDMEMMRSEEHTSELQSPYDLVCRLLLEKK